MRKHVSSIFILLLLSVLILDSCKPDENEIYNAVHYGQIETLRKSLREIDTNKPIKGEFLLFIAAEQGDLECIKLLLENGADINTQSNEFKSSLLHYSIYRFPVEFINYLFDRGIDLELKDKDGLTALFLAIYEDEVDKAMRLIVLGADTQYSGHNGVSIWGEIAFCIDDGYTEVASIALEHGGIIENSGSKNGLYAAVLEGKYKYIEWLLKNGADPNIEMNDGLLPIDYAWEYSLVSSDFETDNNPDTKEKEERVNTALRIESILMEYGSRSAR